MNDEITLDERKWLVNKKKITNKKSYTNEMKKENKKENYLCASLKRNRYVIETHN